jgi:hypothetical protein
MAYLKIPYHRVAQPIKYVAMLIKFVAKKKWTG